MKTQIKFAVVALGLMLTANAKAQDFQRSSGIKTPTFLAKFYVLESSFKLRVYLGKQEGKETTVILNLKDAEGNEIYSTKFGKSEKQSVILLNMEQLADGNYTLEMGDKYGMQSKVFVKRTDNVLVKKEKYLIALNDEPIKK